MGVTAASFRRPTCVCGLFLVLPAALYLSPFLLVWTDSAYACVPTRDADTIRYDRDKREIARRVEAGRRGGFVCVSGIDFPRTESCQRGKPRRDKVY